jgi:hypothetical protein
VTETAFAAAETVCGKQGQAPGDGRYGSDVIIKIGGPTFAGRRRYRSSQMSFFFIALGNYFLCNKNAPRECRSALGKEEAADDCRQRWNVFRNTHFHGKKVHK